MGFCLQMSKHELVTSHYHNELRRVEMYTFTDNGFAATVIRLKNYSFADICIYMVLKANVWILYFLSVVKSVRETSIKLF